ncbi:MAG: hypothetical protein WA199_11440, partial [Xanthobacteraceae bacterium]
HLFSPNQIAKRITLSASKTIPLPSALSAEDCPIQSVMELVLDTARQSIIKILLWLMTEGRNFCACFVGFVWGGLARK